MKALSWIYHAKLRIRCVKCGRELLGSEIVIRRNLGAFPACIVCDEEVDAEVAREYGYWPAGWWGHSHRSDDGLLIIIE